MIFDTRDKIIWMREAKHDIAGFFGEKSDLLDGEPKFFAHLKNAFRIFGAHHVFLERLGQAPKTLFNFFLAVY